MDNTFSLTELSQTGNLDSNLLTRQYKLKLMAQFVEPKFDNLTLKQSEIAKKLGSSSGTLEQYRQDINMFLPYRIPPNTHKRKQKT